MGDCVPGHLMSLSACFRQQNFKEKQAVVTIGCLLLPEAKVRLLEIRPRRHGQPMGVKQRLCGKCSQSE